MSDHGLQMVEEMLWQKTGEETGADQKFEPADTNGEPKPGGSDGHATDPSTYPSTSTCSAASDHYPPQPVQARAGRHRRIQL